MPERLRCPHGHEWQAVSTTATAFPKCGAPAALASTILPAAAPPQPTTVANVKPAVATSPAAARAAVIPGYEILAELGRGGMGVVFKARQIQADRVVALKMILAGALAGPDDVARFKTEAQAVARLQHPGIIQVHEVGEHQGLPYFSLEFAAGGSLHQMLRGQPLPPRPAAQLTRLLAEAVQAAHDAGILHRDLKPANIFLAPTRDATGVAIGENPRARAVTVTDSTAASGRFLPKIGDFGLAKQLANAPEASATGGTR